MPSYDEAAEVSPGLEGLVVALTGIGDVRSAEGFYHYRGYDALELARHSSLDSVAHLVLVGHMPDDVELQSYRALMSELRVLPDQVLADLEAVVRDSATDPITLLRTVVSWYSTTMGWRSWIDVGGDEVRSNAMQLVAVTPLLLAAIYRLTNGLNYVPPDPELSSVANYLYMISGAPAPAEHVAGLESYLISTIEHGFNASTFTARVIASTGADLGASIVGALAAFSGPLHGGAPSRALDMLDEIGSADRAEPWIRSALSRGERIMGFGSRAYAGVDPRSVLLKEIARELGGPLAELGLSIEETIVRVLADVKPGRSLNTNVEFYASIVMQTCGIPREMFTPTFASARVIGWCAHVLEQIGDNRLIRPSARYVERPT